MVLRELRERIIRLVSGGVDPDENRFTDAYVDSLIHAARAFILRQDYLKFKRWSSDAAQVFYPDYEEAFQLDVCVTRFMLPTTFIQGSSLADGLIYFGSTGNALNADNFRRIKSRSELADILNNAAMTPATGRFNAVMIEGLMATIFSKESIKIKYPMISAVWDDPTALPAFNKDKDEYPLSSDMINLVEQYLFSTTLNMVMPTPPDTISNTQDNTVPVKFPRTKWTH